MWNLYFLDSMGKEELVKKDIKYTGIEDSLRLIQDAVKEDISKRRPDFVSCYQRFNFDYDHQEILIDYGSHHEFYLLRLEAKEEE